MRTSVFGDGTCFYGAVISTSIKLRTIYMMCGHLLYVLATSREMCVPSRQMLPHQSACLYRDALEWFRHQGYSLFETLSSRFTRCIQVSQR